MTTRPKKMEQLRPYIDEYRQQLRHGAIQKAYRIITDYMLALRTHLIAQYPNDFVPGQVNYGRMDASYFFFTPQSLKEKGLKIVIAFEHERMQFEIWLVGQNRQIQEKYWTFFKKSDWNQYPLSPTPTEAVMGHVLAENPDFDQQAALTAHIETEAMKFIKGITAALG